ncbi:hypothetical protein [Serratia entomophila]|uniref:hypothetical protein n=1 Tax=Serratia entomophila TaxID=42906 RepID=UPI0021776343|nr:hypothetical protein [Serratia entomophila]CAI0826586.1 Uncharacterised protein [Serratia entomophila]CAI1657917.1 Uncharacterised protein [Serratia entomophila]CAI1924398.1 Uncharacterised protein [Serratia entomophila]
MLEYYFGSDLKSSPEQKKRLLAVQAALEIAKSSASSSVAANRVDKVEYDLKSTAAEIEALADAIQKALEKL